MLDKNRETGTLWGLLLLLFLDILNSVHRTHVYAHTYICTVVQRKNETPLFISMQIIVEK